MLCVYDECLFFDDKINPLLYYFYDFYFDLFVHFKYIKKGGEKKFVLVGKNNWARKKVPFFIFLRS